ncbi:MAG: 2,3,4,5-tetrahydropyridine-2,6-dicarboxylate N-succinyltransferase [Holosporaceae bacterium]|jgi:2,3,4,5-tetrahydropyridine-2-carboxylate N-succinyltransferase|nr:2,3,4,5-tetrahydropyridine-2,6-dicarboxylate N-succinyltransferase [Holosporaceae bacterium]
MSDNLQKRIKELWETDTADISCIQEVLDKLDCGALRIANKINGVWQINDYLKKAILLYFKHTKSHAMPGGYFDKISLKTCGWTEARFQEAGIRMVPGCVIRYSAYIAKSVILMPSFVNVGAYIDEGTMIDTHALVGSCAQVGKRCHISDGVTIGGVLEPPQAMPVVIEDNCFIGARCAILEGVIVEEGAVLAAGTILSSSTKILDRESGDVSYGRVPPRAVVVPGTYPSKNVNICCAVIVKRVDEKTRRKASINELLRV